MRKGFIKSAVMAAAMTITVGLAFAAGEITGKVVDTMDSGGYTYVQLENKGKKFWVAAPQLKVVKGQTASFNPGMEMTNFESKTLKRKFDKIIFTDGFAKGSGVSAADQAKDGGSKTKVVATKEKIKVSKAEGANSYTVADVYKNSKTLNNKPVVVTGKVVKFSPGIMKRNWVHIQDGTGDAKKGNHNLVVTTNDTVAVGDVVTASGTMLKDKDFGSGYKYDVIIEQATVKKK